MSRIELEILASRQVSTPVAETMLDGIRNVDIAQENDSLRWYICRSLQVADRRKVPLVCSMYKTRGALLNQPSDLAIQSQ
jgi:hypothetical protein